MTESEWLTCTTRPSLLAEYVVERVPARKQTLLSVACCYLIWDHIPERALQDVVRAMGRFADGENDSESDRNDLIRAADIYGLSVRLDRESVSYAALHAIRGLLQTDQVYGAGHCIQWILECVSRSTLAGVKRSQLKGYRHQICDLFREVIGNPFRPWKSVADFLGGGVVQPDGQTVHLSDTVTQLARGIHTDQAFDRLPILADALEESGFTDAALLDHCRNESRHVRGCWALDVALGRV